MSNVHVKYVVQNLKYQNIQNGKENIVMIVAHLVEMVIIHRCIEP